MVVMLGGVVELERELTFGKSGKGLTSAMAPVAKIGRKPKLMSYRIKEAIMCHNRREGKLEITRIYNLLQCTISRPAL